MEKTSSVFYRARPHTALLVLSDDLVQVGTSPTRSVCFSGVTASQVAWLKRVFTSRKRLYEPTGADRQRIWQVLRQKDLLQSDEADVALRLRCDDLNRVTIPLLRSLAVEKTASFDLRGKARVDEVAASLFDAEDSGMRTAAVLKDEFARQGVAVTKHSRVDAAIVCSSRVLDQGKTATFLGQEIPHLPIVIDEERITVGPMIIPGITPCALCQELYLLDATPDWPNIRQQLERFSAVIPPMALAFTAAGIGASMLQEYWRKLLNGQPLDNNLGWEISSLGQRSFTLDFHSACTCQMSTNDLQDFSSVKTRTYGANTGQHS